MDQLNLPSRERGISIIEVMIVCVLVAIVLGYAVPNLSILGTDGRVRAAASDLLGDLYFARSKAIQLNADVTITSVSGSNDWSSGWRVTCTGPAACARPLRQRSAYSGVSLQAVQSSAGFGVDGRPATAAARTFQVQPMQTASSGLGRMRCLAIGVGGTPTLRVDRDTDAGNGC